MEEVRYTRQRRGPYMNSRLWLWQFRSSSPPLPLSPPRQATPACIAVSSKAIMGLKEVVVTKDDDCAICLKALANRYQEDDAASAEMAMSRSGACRAPMSSTSIASLSGLVVTPLVPSIATNSPARMMMMMWWRTRSSCEYNVFLL